MFCIIPTYKAKDSFVAALAAMEEHMRDPEERAAPVIYFKHTNSSYMF